MKKIALFIAVAIMLGAGTRQESQYQETYQTWQAEMAAIATGHEQALAILDGFRQKIDQHKARIREFGTYIDTATQEIAALSGTEQAGETAALEAAILAKCNANMKKHTHFLVFLNNLSALQGVFEDRPFALTGIPEEHSITQFASLADAIAFWAAEMDAINAGHDRALSIIDDLKAHIHRHQAQIARFTQSIEDLQDRAAMADKAEKQKTLEVMQADLEENYLDNRQKHEHFVGFLQNLRLVQEQFDGR